MRRWRTPAQPLPIAVVLALLGTACSRDVLHTGATGTTVAPSLPVPIHASAADGCDAGVDGCSAQGSGPVGICDPGLIACPGPGAGYCFDLQTSPDHCGTCDHACALGSPCENGQCRVVHCTSQMSTRSLPVEGLSFRGYGVAPTDCDRDGNLDLLAFLPDIDPTFRRSVGVIRGTGDGTFVPGERYIVDTPFWPSRWIQVADLNRDQIPDLLVMFPLSDLKTTADSQQFKVIVRLGNGDCSFGSEIDLDVGTGIGSLAIGDLDGDQIPDLAASAGERVSIFHGNGDGGFANRQDVAVGGAPTQMAITDWNSDGIADVVARDEYLHLLLGTGGGHFAPAIDCALKVSSLVFADFDEDGVVDLASGNAVWFGMHECNITRQIALTKDQYTGPLVAGDFNGDGAMDIVFRSELDVGFLPGDGHGNFGAAVTLERQDPEMHGGLPPPPVTHAGDFNGDGRLDLMVTEPSNGTHALINTCQ